MTGTDAIPRDVDAPAGSGVTLIKKLRRAERRKKITALLLDYRPIAGH